MNYEYPDQQIIHDPQPCAVYYTQGSDRLSRRHYKRELLITFINHTTTPKQRRNRTAPARPSLLNTLLSLFV